MKDHAREKPHTRFYKVIDVCTGKEIPDCLWADDETGEYCIYVKGEDGKIKVEWENPKYRHIPIERWRTDKNRKYGDLKAKTMIKKGKIRFVDTRKTP